MAGNDRKFELEWLNTRLTVMEHMLAYIIRRLGGNERHMREWYGRRKTTGNSFALHGAVNVLLNSLKPPPRRE